MSANLKPTSTWRKVSAKLQDDEAYEKLDRLTRLEVFQAHIRHLEDEEKQHKEREKEAKRRKVSSSTALVVADSVSFFAVVLVVTRDCSL